jgi:O-antigen ligase
LIIANSNVNELLGFGFASFGSGDFDIYFPYYRPPHPHSSFISVIFETGYIGFLLIIIYVVVQIKEIQNRQGNKKLSYSAFLIFFTVLGSLTGANIASKLSLLFSLMLLFSIIENHNHAQHKRP